MCVLILQKNAYVKNGSPYYLYKHIFDNADTVILHLDQYFIRPKEQKETERQDSFYEREILIFPVHGQMVVYFHAIEQKSIGKLADKTYDGRWPSSPVDIGYTRA